MGLSNFFICVCWFILASLLTLGHANPLLPNLREEYVVLILSLLTAPVVVVGGCRKKLSALPPCECWSWACPNAFSFPQINACMTSRAPCDMEWWFFAQSNASRVFYEDSIDRVRNAMMREGNRWRVWGRAGRVLLCKVKFLHFVLINTYFMPWLVSRQRVMLGACLVLDCFVIVVSDSCLGYIYIFSYIKSLYPS